jgi:hypothetical protein
MHVLFCATFISADSDYHLSVWVPLPQKCAPLLCHPSTWIRGAAIDLIVAIAEALGVAKTHVAVMPHLRPFLHAVPRVSAHSALTNFSSSSSSSSSSSAESTKSAGSSSSSSAESKKSAGSSSSSSSPPVVLVITRASLLTWLRAPLSRTTFDRALRAAADADVDAGTCGVGG